MRARLGTYRFGGSTETRCPAAWRAAGRRTPCRASTGGIARGNVRNDRRGNIRRRVPYGDRHQGGEGDCHRTSKTPRDHPAGSGLVTRDELRRRKLPKDAMGLARTCARRTGGSLLPRWSPSASGPRFVTLCFIAPGTRCPVGHAQGSCPWRPCAEAPTQLVSALATLGGHLRWGYAETRLKRPRGARSKHGFACRNYVGRKTMLGAPAASGQLLLSSQCVLAFIDATNFARHRPCRRRRRCAGPRVRYLSGRRCGGRAPRRRHQLQCSMICGKFHY